MVKIQEAPVQSQNNCLECGQENHFQVECSNRIKKIVKYSNNPSERVLRTLRIADVEDGIGLFAALFNSMGLVIAVRTRSLILSFFVLHPLRLSQSFAQPSPSPPRHHYR